MGDSSVITTLNLGEEEFVRNGDELVESALLTIKNKILIDSITAPLGVDEFTLFEAVSRVNRHVQPCGADLYTLDGEKILKFTDHTVKTSRDNSGSVIVAVEVFYRT